MPENGSKPRRWQTPHLVQGAVLLLGFFLVLLSLGAMVLVRHLVERQERQVGAYLEPVARGIVDPPRVYFWFLDLLTDPATGRLDEEALADYSGLEDWRQLALSLQGEDTTPFVSSISLLSLSGEVIMDAHGAVLPADERTSIYASEADAVRAVVATGAPHAVPMERGIDPTPQRYYYPVRNEAGRVVAVLRAEADAEYLEDLFRLRRNIFMGFVVTNVLLLVVGALTMNLVRRTLEAERAAAHSDRLRALGTLTAGIAHEVRNPLGIIALQAEELEACLPTIPEGPTRAILEEVARDLRSETRRLKELTETFLQFTRPGEAHPQRAVPLQPVVTALVRLWEKGLPPGRREVEITAQVPADLAVLFTEDRLRQVLLNLLRNADEALGDEPGRIAVRLEHRGDTVAVEVEDNGPGIPPAILEQIFDPFFTTRAEGTGLGLPLSRTLARHAGGDLQADSTPGRGARFTLVLRVAG